MHHLKLSTKMIRPAQISTAWSLTGGKISTGFETHRRKKTFHSSLREKWQIYQASSLNSQLPSPLNISSSDPQLQLYSPCLSPNQSPGHLVSFCMYRWFCSGVYSQLVASYRDSNWKYSIKETVISHSWMHCAALQEESEKGPKSTTATDQHLDILREMAGVVELRLRVLVEGASAGRSRGRWTKGCRCLC